MMKLVFVILLLLVLAGLLSVRLAPSDPLRWHVDPTEAESPGKAGVLFRPDGGDAQAPVWQMSPKALLAAFDAVADSAPRTVRLAGSVEEGLITYVSRTRWIGFPDYISVRAVAVDDGATLAILSRLRFGSSDMGVNRARIEEWLGRIKPGS